MVLKSPITRTTSIGNRKIKHAKSRRIEFRWTERERERERAIKVRIFIVHVAASHDIYSIPKPDIT